MPSAEVSLIKALTNDAYFSASSSLSFLAASLPADGCASCTRPMGACVALATLDELAFYAVLYPGVLRAAIPVGSPKSLRDLLHKPVHKAFSAAVAEGGATRARAVLTGASRSAVSAGEAPMSVIAARTLWPRVFSDAFAAELPAAAYKAAGGTAKVTPTNLASPYSFAAASPNGALVGIALSGVVGAGVGGTTGWPFRSSDAIEWTALVAADAFRLSRDEPTAWLSSPSSETCGGSGSLNVKLTWAWLDVERATLDYPALAEIAMRLAALPYEINRLASRARLHASPAATVLIRRWECDWKATIGPTGVDSASTALTPLTAYVSGDKFLLDTGNVTTKSTKSASPPKLTAVYMVGENESTPNDVTTASPSSTSLPPFLVLQVAPAVGEPVAFDLCTGGNRLLLYRARDARSRSFATAPASAPPSYKTRTRTTFAISLVFGGEGDEW